MSTLTPVGSRLQIALDAEYLRMLNEWFFRWHHIGGESTVEIDSFDGRMIRYGGIKFMGTARDVYWSTIQRYARQKVGQLFDGMEVELQKYPVEIRSKALGETEALIRQFVAKIRRAAIEKDRILRGNGFEFPPPQELGNWSGALSADIEARAAMLRHIYCDLEIVGGEDGMPFRDLATDRVTLVKADGTTVRENIQASVQAGKIFTFDADLPLEPGDHFLRTLPSGLVEDFVVDDPNFMTGIHGIPSSFQSKVHRSREGNAPKQQVIERITNHFHGENARVTIGTDNSVNLVSHQLQPLAVAGLLEEIKSNLGSLPEPQRTEMAVPLALLEDEVRKPSPENSKLREGLASLRKIAESVTSSLIAAGIKAMIDHQLGGAGS